MVGADSLSAYIYIYHLGLEFNLPVVPTSFSDNMPISFQATSILGRSAPLQTYTGAGPRSVNISLNLHRHMFALENPQLDAITGQKYVTMMDPSTGTSRKVKAVDGVDLLVNAITALSLPKYLDATKAIVPPSVLVRFGDELAIRGVPSNVQKQTDGVWLKNNKLANVVLTFTITEVEPYSAQYAAANGSLRGISTTLERSSVWQY